MEVHMRSKTIVSAVMAACMGLSGLAVAQQDKDVRAAQAGQMSRPERGHSDHRSDRDHGRPPPPRYEAHRDRGPGAGPDHNFYRGGRLPPQYRSNVYVVDDWRGHRLSAPPRGYHWVQTGGDYVLVAVATGIIASILLNH